ncbi:MAG: hypothetical protein M1135_03060 [Candidatus Omnitrophica bacterium]|nr:hypothetical protein [Candidatus Omnitrophota bacterium]
MENKIFYPKIIRSPYSDFYGREIEDFEKAYPDWYLKEIKDEGFDSVWIHCILREIVSCKPFPEFGNKEKINHLKKFVEKLSKYDIKIFLYLCEPRGFKENDKFWEKYSDVKGQPAEFKEISDLSGKYFALCSSTQKVKDFLYESCYNLFKQVSGLGGAFLITASEFHTHCYSHYPKWQEQVKNFPEMVEWAKHDFYCKRCEEREPYQVVSEIINLINKGIKDADKKAKVIAWAWSWNIIEPDPQKKLINSLPSDVILMIDWERGGYKFFQGKKYPVDEYSASYIGPSPRFRKIFQISKKRGLKVMAKLQMATTHELVTVPYIPVIFNFAEKIDKMRKIGVNGFLYCWIFGGNISPVSKIVGLLSNKKISKYQAIKETAEKEFGKNAAKYVTEAWKIFSSSFKKYPFSIPFLYNSPINYATIYPFSIEADKIEAIPSWRPLPQNEKGYLKVGDNLETWTNPFKPETVVYQLEKMAKEWEKGLKIIKEVNEENERLKKEIDLGYHIYLTSLSTANIIKFYLALRKYKEDRKEKRKKEIIKILKSEIEITEKDRDIFKRNKDFGYHSEAFENFLTENRYDYKIKILKSQIFQG